MVERRDRAAVLLPHKRKRFGAFRYVTFFSDFAAWALALAVPDRAWRSGHSADVLGRRVLVSL